MTVDVHRLLVAGVGGHASVSATTTTVATELVSGWTAPAVLVTRFGGQLDDVAGHIDAARVQLDCYGATEAGAWSLASAVIAALRALPGSHATGVVSDVMSISQAWSPDPAFDRPRPRVVVTATVYIHPAPS